MTSESVNGWTASQIKEFITAIMDERGKRLDDRFKAQDARLTQHIDATEKALKLQADEYARRLNALNGEYQRDVSRQAAYVTVDKYEDKLKSEATARSAALLRVDEKFEDYVKRYEVRQREVDILLAAQKGAAEAAVRAAEEQGRKANRNIALASVGLAALIFLAQIIPFFH